MYGLIPWSQMASGDRDSIKKQLTDCDIEFGSIWQDEREDKRYMISNISFDVDRKNTLITYESCDEMLGAIPLTTTEEKFRANFSPRPEP